MTTKYYILDKATGNILHESHTDFNPIDKEQLKHLLANTFWTPLSIVHMYLKNPDSIEIKVVSDDVIEVKEPIKPKRTYKKKKTNDNNNNQE